VVDEEWCVIFLVRMCFSCGVVVWFLRWALILVKRCIPFFIVRYVPSCSMLVAVYRVQYVEKSAAQKVEVYLLKNIVIGISLMK